MVLEEEIWEQEICPWGANILVGDLFPSIYWVKGRAEEVNSRLLGANKIRKPTSPLYRVT